MFDHLYGNDEIKRLLSLLIKRMARNLEYSSSFLFLGKGGVGKRQFALEFARLVNCTGTMGRDCLCNSCKKIKANEHPDVVVVDSEKGVISVEKARELVEEASFRSYEAKKRFFIVDNADQMNKQAGNAVLKLLEDLRENTIFIFIAKNTNTMLETVRSRFKVFEFRRIDGKTMAEYAKNVMHVEDPIKLKKMIIYADGSIRAMSDSGVMTFIYEELDRMRVYLKNQDIPELFKQAELWQDYEYLDKLLKVLYDTEEGTNHVKLIESKVYNIYERGNKEAVLKSLFLQMVLNKKEAK